VLPRIALAQSVSHFAVSGAETSSNADGSIPESRGMTDSPLPGWTPGESRVRFSPYGKEIPLRIIDQNNVNQFETMLPPGAVALLKSKPGYTMPIYPTHRSCGLPPFVAQNTIRFQGRAHISRNGWSIEDAVLPSVPFRTHALEAKRFGIFLCNTRDWVWNGPMESHIYHQGHQMPSPFSIHGRCVFITHGVRRQADHYEKAI